MMRGCAPLNSTKNSLGIIGDANAPLNDFARTRNKVVFVSGMAAIRRSAEGLMIVSQKLTSTFPATANAMTGPFGLEWLPKCRNIRLMEHTLMALGEKGMQPPVEGRSENI